MSKLTRSQIAKASADAQVDFCLDKQPTYEVALARRIEAAATEPLLQRIAHLEATASANYGRGHADAHSMLSERIAELEANEKVLLAQVQGHTEWREKIVKASEQAYGESAIRYKFSLTKTGKCMNTFPKEIDGRWFALVPAEDDGHIGHIARLAELERQLEEARNQALEEAAKVCDELAELSRTSPTDSMWQHGECAAAIRALKGAKE